MNKNSNFSSIMQSQLCGREPSVSIPGALRSMKNGYYWYNVFILFDFGYEVWRMFMLVKNPNGYRLPEVPK